LYACACAIALALAAPELSAQRFEVHPYVGGFNADRFALGELKTHGLYGVKGGMFFTDRFQMEGNVGYINHFEFEQTDSESRGVLWEAVSAFHFRPHRLGASLQPFVSMGLGGITALVPDNTAVVFRSERQIFIKDPFLNGTRPFDVVRSILWRTATAFLPLVTVAA
jgi:hypothetical protein